jgi:hypothetical protein
LWSYLYQETHNAKPNVSLCAQVELLCLSPLWAGHQQTRCGDKFNSIPRLYFGKIATTGQSDQVGRARLATLTAAELQATLNESILLNDMRYSSHFKRCKQIEKAFESLQKSSSFLLNFTCRLFNYTVDILKMHIYTD